MSSSNLFDIDTKLIVYHLNFFIKGIEKLKIKKVQKWKKDKDYIILVNKNNLIFLLKAIIRKDYSSDFYLEIIFYTILLQVKNNLKRSLNLLKSPILKDKKTIFKRVYERLKKLIKKKLHRKLIIEFNNFIIMSLIKV